MANQYTTNLFSVVPVGNHQRISGLATAQTITIPQNATGVYLQADGQNVYMVLGTGGSIGVGTGFLIRTTDMPIRWDLFPGAVIRVLEATAGGAVNVMFFRSV